MRLLAVLSLFATSSINLARGQAFPPAVDLTKQLDLLNGMDIKAIRVDGRGDVYLGGWTTVAFNDPIVRRIGAGVGNGTGDLMIVKMNSTLDHVYYATLIGGSDTDLFDAMKVDADGNVYVAGSTYSQNFPLSGRLKQEFTSGAFVLKLSAAGDGMIYSTLLGQKMEPHAIDVDASGAVYIGGFAAPLELPSTPGVFRPSPLLDVNPTSFFPFLLKLDRTGASVVFATYFSSSAVTDSMDAVSVRPNGQIVFVAGQTLGAFNSSASHLDFSIPVGSGQKSLGFDAAGNIYVGGGILSGGTLGVQKFSPGGAAVFESQFEHGSMGYLRGSPLLVSPAGTVYLFGDAYTGVTFPTRNATQPCITDMKPPTGTAGISDNNAFNWAFAVVGPDGAHLHSTLMPTQIVAPSLSPDGTRIYAVGSQALGNSAVKTSTWRGLLRFDLTRLPTANHVSPSCLAHGALYGSAVAATPGAIMTIYGSNLGPEVGAVFALRDNHVPSQLAGTTVTVDGVPAPVLYAQDTQVNFIVPWSLRVGPVIPICVIRGSDTGCLDAGTAPAVAGTFLYQDRSIVVNQDGTLNSPENPAPRGTIVSFYLTGTGTLQGPLDDGSVSGLPLQILAATVAASFADDGPQCYLFDPNCPSVPPIPAEVQYAGSAPTLVSGVTVINVRVPDKVPPGPRRVFYLNFAMPGGTFQTSTSGVLAVRSN